ncbi:unnamed protein product [Pleuronectes platessa]|uniref:Uncharacterized protein n=1 Tax=Pleuronectes platessa TaxID=8262 RepID=A0A9N7Z6X5_PLEPL|nr:unnamed protein product [Pleuronectes platessa]
MVEVRGQSAIKRRRVPRQFVQVRENATRVPPNPRESIGNPVGASSGPQRLDISPGGSVVLPSGAGSYFVPKQNTTVEKHQSPQIVHSLCKQPLDLNEHVSEPVSYRADVRIAS